LWQDDPAKLQDADAVVDSKFRVHGVRGLRIVDTSVFHKIPGYFIVTPTFMISERAADVLLEDSESYPNALECREADAVRRRRAAAKPKCPPTRESADTQPAPTPNTDDLTRLPTNTVGLALSGGGVRSATYCLGVLQALAEKGRLRDIDMMSSVSGGGYIAGFLGRLHTRQPTAADGDPAERVERTLKDLGSSELQWLRYHAQYILGGGRHDVRSDIAVILRNLAAVHVWIGSLLFGVLGAVHWFMLTCSQYPLVSAICDVAPPKWNTMLLSPWWWLPILLFVVGVLPPSIGYWLTMRRRPDCDWRSWLPFFLWLVMLIFAIYGLSLPDIEVWSAAAIGVLLLAWFEQQAAWVWMSEPPESDTPATPLNPGNRQPDDGASVVRNRLTRLLGAALFGFVASLLFVVLDTLAQFISANWMRGIAWIMGGAAPLLVLQRGITASVLKGAKQKIAKGKNKGKSSPNGKSKTFVGGLVTQTLLSVFAFALAFVLLMFVDVLVYIAFTLDIKTAQFLVVAALGISVVKGRALPFLKLSSLHQI
jgi:hypothetical protein